MNDFHLFGKTGDNEKQGRSPEPEKGRFLCTACKQPLTPGEVNYVNKERYCRHCIYLVEINVKPFGSQELPKSLIVPEQSGKAKERFERERTCNGMYIPAPAEGDAYICGDTITYEREKGGGIKWAKIKNGEIRCFRTFLDYSEFSGYHDEDNDYYATQELTEANGQGNLRTFMNHLAEQTGVADSDQPFAGSDDLQVDALYYEAHGKAFVGRFQERVWMSHSFPASMVVYLRRCCKGYRLLRISLRSAEIPFVFDFKEESIPELLNMYENQCALFEDFYLSKTEISKLLPDWKRHDWSSENSIAGFNPREMVSFVRRSGNKETEIIEISAKKIKGLMMIRNLALEDYWDSDTYWND